MEIRYGDPVFHVAIGINGALRQRWNETSDYMAQHFLGGYRRSFDISPPDAQDAQTMCAAPIFRCPPIFGKYDDYGRIAVDDDESYTAQRFVSMFPVLDDDHDRHVLFRRLSNDTNGKSDQLGFPLVGIHETPYFGLFVSGAAYSLLPTLPVTSSTTIRKLVDKELERMRSNISAIARCAAVASETPEDVYDLWGATGLTTMSQRECAIGCFPKGYTSPDAHRFFTLMERMLTIQYGAALLGRPLSVDVRLRGPQMGGSESLVTFNLAWMGLS